MRVLRHEVLPCALLALVLVGCAPTSSAPDAPTEPGPTAEATAADALVGSYTVEYQTTESDHDADTDETIVRDAEVTGSCTGSQCDLAFTTELKAADGSTMSVTTDLTFDGTTYRGTQTSTFACDGLSSLTTVEDGLEYTSETEIITTATAIEDGRVVVVSFSVVTVEHNEITAAGLEAGCLRINFSGPDPYVSNTTTVGVGTRQP